MYTNKIFTKGSLRKCSQSPIKAASPSEYELRIIKEQILFAIKDMVFDQTVDGIIHYLSFD